MRIETPRVRKDATAHSSLVGGSTAYLRLRCNGSIIEERKAPPEEWSPYAAAGTALHTVMERAITDNLGNVDVLDQFEGAEIEHVTITEQMLRDKVIPALEFFDETVPMDASVFVEAKVSFGRQFPEDTGAFAMPVIEGAFGTADIVFNDGSEAGVIDWKFGDGVIVSADDNDQGRFYLCGAIQQGLLPVADEYEFWIFQPAAKLTPDKYATCGRYSLKDLRDFAVRLHDAVTGPTVYNAGEHCAKCKGRLTCRAYAEMLTTAVKTDVAGMNTAELAANLARIPAIQKWCKDVEAAALRNAQNGLSIPGYVLEPSIGNRAYVDEDAAWHALGRLGLDANTRTVKKCIAPAKAMEALASIGTPAKSIERFERRHIVRPQNGQKLRKAKPGECDAGAMERLSGALKARGL